MHPLFVRDCRRLVYALLALCVSVAAFGADQKPLVINPTTGKQEQLQPGNRLQIPDATGDLITINPNVQTAARVITYPVMTGDRTLAVSDQAQTFANGQVFSNALTISGASAVPVLNSTAATDPTTSAYFSFQRNSVEKGWIGYGDGVSGIMKVYNSLGVIRIQATGSTEIVGTTASTSTITGSLINAGGFGNAGAIYTANVVVTGGASAEGGMWIGAANGLNLRAKTGSVYDFTLQNAAGSVNVLSVATGTSNVVFGAGITVGSATLISSNVALTNGAAAQVGTLTNAPAAGNPTKWIPINDNGTTRYIPAW